MNAGTSTFLTAAQIASQTGVCKKTIHRRAAREAWQWRWAGNRLEYLPPANLAAPHLREPLLDLAPLISVEDRALLRRATIRLLALAELRAAIDKGIAHEQALSRVAEAFTFHTSVSSLRRWARAYLAHGITGLFEAKRGRVGRKPKGPGL